MTTLIAMTKIYFSLTAGYCTIRATIFLATSIIIKLWTVL